MRTGPAVRGAHPTRPPILRFSGSPIPFSPIPRLLFHWLSTLLIVSVLLQEKARHERQANTPPARQSVLKHGLHHLQALKDREFPQPSALQPRAASQIQLTILLQT